MTLKILKASTIAFILFTGCTLLNKNTTRTPQGGIKSAFKLFAKVGNQAAEALRRGEKDMQGKNLQGVHLQKLDLTDADFRHADLEGARLQGTVWRGTKAQGANFKKARCQGADFQGARLWEKNETTGQVTKAIFKKAKLQRANMYSTALEGLDFRGANLNGANLQQSAALKADFRGANFKGTNLQDSSVQGADFREAKNLNEAKWEEAEYSVNTKFPDGFNPKEHGMRLDLNGADLRGQYVGDLDFENAKFYNLANLEGATYKLGQKFPEGFFDPIEHKMVMDLRDTDLSAKTLGDVNFWDADMARTDLKEAALYGSDLSKVKNLEEANLQGTYYDLDTEFPEGFAPKEHNMVLDLAHMDLKKIDLRGRDLKNAKFGEVDLNGVDFRGANVSGVDFRGAKNLNLAKLEEAYWDYYTKFSSPVMKEHILKKFLRERGLILDLRGKDLRDAMTGVEGGKGAWANQAEPMHDLWMNYRSEPPIFVDFNGADLRGLSFHRQDCEFFLNLHRANLEGATYTRRTNFPEDFKPEDHGMILREE